MRQTFLTGLIGATMLAIACGPGASQSHNSSQAGATDRAGVANAGNQPPVTLTGCLRNADRPEVDPATPTGTLGGGSARSASDQMAAGNGAPGERYTLTNAKSESAASSPTSASYILDGNMADLRAHVDEQVRVSGTLDATAANTAGPQRIRVASVDTIAESCVR